MFLWRTGENYPRISIKYSSLSSPLYTVCHFVFDFRLKPLFAPVDMSKHKNGGVHFKNSGMKGLKSSFPLVGSTVRCSKFAYIAPTMKPCVKDLLYISYSCQFTLQPSFIEPYRKKTYLRTFVPSEDSDQPAHLCSLTRIFTLRLLDSQGCKVSPWGQRRL